MSILPASSALHCAVLGLALARVLRRAPISCSLRLTWASRLRMALAVAVVGSGVAHAQQYGDGHSGQLLVTSTQVINASAVITQDATAGSLVVSLASTAAFSPSDPFVLIIRMQWAAGQDRSDVGQFEVATISQVLADKLILTAPLTHTYPATVSQVVTLPAYTSVDIAPDAGLVAPKWNGSGGVLAFLVSGTLINNGVLDARGAGFRGGTGVNSVDERGGCTANDTPAPGGAQRGEGAQFGGFGPAFTGRGNNDSGGGGGMCPFSGGGGGGRAGEGGLGGFARDSSNTGGLAGSRINNSGLVLGGGGGATNGLAGDQRNGGNGGGIIYIASIELGGTGRITANGEDGLSVTNGVGSGSGAGAGGTVWLDVADHANCAISAEGGHGGDTISTGPGGGGGGGFIHLQTESIGVCSTSVVAGSAGLANGESFGAGPLLTSASPSLGTQEIIDGQAPPATPPVELKVKLVPTGCGCHNAPTNTALAAVLAGLFALRRKGRRA